jgi:hypothetical protein
MKKYRFYKMKTEDFLFQKPKGKVMACAGGLVVVEEPETVDAEPKVKRRRRTKAELDQAKLDLDGEVEI